MMDEIFQILAITQYLSLHESSRANVPEEYLQTAFGKIIYCYTTEKREAKFLRKKL
jgi:hypothetical protein